MGKRTSSSGSARSRPTPIPASAAFPSRCRSSKRCSASSSARQRFPPRSYRAGSLRRSRHCPGNSRRSRSRSPRKRFHRSLERKKLSGAFGLSLVGGGIAVLYFSTFAGFQIYHLLDQVPSFAIMALITVLAGALSVYYDSKWLAVLGLVGGFLTPVLLTTVRDNQIALMTYMTMLKLGLLGLG